MKGEVFSWIFSQIEADDTYEVSVVFYMISETTVDVDHSISIDADGIITLDIDSVATSLGQTFFNHRYSIRMESVSGVVSYPFEGILRFIPTASAA